MCCRGERARLRLVDGDGGEGGGSNNNNNNNLVSWAIDNLFIGDSCPWMCSGHGTCSHHNCRSVGFDSQSQQEGEDDPIVMFRIHHLVKSGTSEIC